MSFYSLLPNYPPEDVYVRRLVLVTLLAYPFGGGEAYMKDSMKMCASSFSEIIWLSFAKVTPQGRQYHLQSELHYPFPGEKRYEHVVFFHAGKQDYEEGEDAGGVTIDKRALSFWLRLLDPDLVHHQGPDREIVQEVCLQELHIPLVSGFHFWNGALHLSPKHQNRNILRHISDHKKEDEFVQTCKYAQDPCTPFHFYVVSPFMVDVLATLYEEYGAFLKNRDYVPTIAPVSDLNTSLAQQPSNLSSAVFPHQHKAITQVNVHAGKGGLLFLQCMRHFTKVPFQYIVTEPGCDDLYESMKNEAKERPGQTYIYETGGQDMRVIYRQSLVCLIPSLVDETFCRVALEALCNGVPVVASNRGNLGYLLEGMIGAYVLDPEKEDLWFETIDRCILSLSASEWYDFSSTIQNAALMKACELKLEADRSLLQLFQVTGTQSRCNNVMIFTPWVDQGLGIQSRNYARILQKHSNGTVRVYIFAFRPYAGDTERLQVEQKEWQQKDCGIAGIYYSPNVREKVTETELSDFVHQYHIGTAIIPEICWDAIFQHARHLRFREKVRVFAIPNIEIVRKDELHLYEDAFGNGGILCNNQICFDLLSRELPGATKRLCLPIGYATLNTNEKEETMVSQPKHSSRVTFLCFGGMNAFLRKQVDVVTKSFWNVPKTIRKGTQVHLMVFSQAERDTEPLRGLHRATLLESVSSESSLSSSFFLVPKSDKTEEHESCLIGAILSSIQPDIRCHITFVCGGLSHRFINTLHRTLGDVVIQVSKHEGLGLGFYEALSHGLPVVTLDIPPHNELIRPNVNGWLVPATMVPSSENNSALVFSGTAEVSKLTKVLLEEVLHESNTESLGKKISRYQSQTVCDYMERFDVSLFAARFMKALRLW